MSTMRICLFYHSLLSDWNHGNAHFLRGIVSELLLRGHEVRVFEPSDGWSLQSLKEEQGEAAIEGFRKVYPGLESSFYDPDTIDLDDAVSGADLVIVHEWNLHRFVRRVGEHKARIGGYRLLFHDTHHRAVTKPEEMGSYDLSHYDGVLAFGEVLRRMYVERGWAKRAWTWHEAADVRVFRPVEGSGGEETRGRGDSGDLVWIGNWGDEERTAELHEFLLEPVKALGLKARMHGVKYPAEALAALEEAGIAYGGWLPNYRAPEVFSRFKVTVHVPRRPYVEALPGIPTIRVFEALACGIALMCAPWEDKEGLFSQGKDYLVARDGEEMKRHLKALVNEPQLRRELAMHGHRTILSRHTCAHRVDELMEIADQIEPQRHEGTK